MRSTTKTVFITSLLITFLIAGCKKSLDINSNPNQAIDANIDPGSILPGALVATGTNVDVGYDFLARWMGYITVSSGVSPNAEEVSYNITNNFNLSTTTTTIYANALFNGLLDLNYDLQAMENKAKILNYPFYTGIAKIMKSYNYARMVDAYNNIPYSEALKGLSNLTPKYDDGKTVYEDLFTQIDLGLSEIKSTDAAANLRLSTADLLFNGDKTKWAKFANTLKLRLLLHQANRTDRQDYIKTQIAKIVAEGSGFLGTGETASVNPGFNQSQPNPYYTTYDFNLTGGEPSQMRANSYALNEFKRSDDPRISVVYQPIKSTPPVGFVEPQPTLAPANYRGGYYGLAIDNTTYKYQTRDYLSKIGGVATPSAASSTSSGIIKGWDMALWIITSTESMFLQAEAIQRGYLPGVAKDAYVNAVKESFRWLNATGTQSGADDAFNKWYTVQVSAANVNVSYDAAPDKLKLIAYQKYLGLTGVDEFEKWDDYRKNGAYPNIPLSLYSGRTSNLIPVRLLYPQSELNYNSANVPSAGSKTGDQFTSKIFWMP
jgi:hypothetical protein